MRVKRCRPIKENECIDCCFRSSCQEQGALCTIVLNCDTHEWVTTEVEE